MDASIHGQFELAANAELLDDYGITCDRSSVEYVLHCTYSAFTVLFSMKSTVNAGLVY